MVRVVRVKLAAEDSVAVTWSTRASFERDIELSGLLEHLLIVHPDNAVVTRCNKLSSIIAVVDG